MNRLVLVLVVLLACAPSRAQEDDEERAYRQREAAEWVGRALPHVDAACSDHGEVVLALWEWRLEGGAPARATVAAYAAAHTYQGDARALLDALLDPPPIPSIDDAPLQVLLVASAGETVLERAIRSARFTRGLDRVALPVALDGLDPRHPWVADVRARLVANELLVRGLGRIFDALALPCDPRAGDRVRLASPEDGDAPWDYFGKATGGWVLERTEAHLRILDDRLRVRRVSVARASSTDVDEELHRWAVPDQGAGLSERDTLDFRGCGALALRAWWALKRGRAWTASRIAEEARINDDDDVGTRLARIAIDLAVAVQEATFIDLSANGPRTAVVAALRRAVAVLDVAAVPTNQRAADAWRRERDDAGNLVDRLEAQDAALRSAPPFPTWAEWQQLTTAERLPHLLRALPDCDGDPSDTLGFGGGGVAGASQRLPLDAPLKPTTREELNWLDGEPPWTFRQSSGCSAADWLVAAGEVAIPALIDALSDLSPTRSVGSDDEAPCRPLTVGECASYILRSIIQEHDVWLSFGALDRHLERQARARAWWTELAPRGGLFALHLSKLLEVDRAQAWSSSHVRWLLRHGGGREVDALRTLTVASPAEAKASWLRVLGRAPHDGYDALLVAELPAEDHRVAMAATRALVERGDRRGLPRALALATDERADDIAVAYALEVLSQGDAQELAAVAFRLVVLRPACDDALRSALEDKPASAERLFTLARIAARTAEPAQDVVTALSEALRLRADPDALEHAAVTSGLLGHEAIAALCSASGHDLRASLLVALVHDDPARRNAAKAALDRLGVAGLRWLTDGAADVPEDVAAAATRASLQVVRVSVAAEVPPGVRVALEGWSGELLDLDRVSEVLEAWEEADMDALELVIARAASGGVRVYATCPVAGADAPGWLLRVVADGAGLTTDQASLHGLRPSSRSRQVLAHVQEALAGHPEDAARIVIRAER